jgi:hypothetical protein
LVGSALARTAEGNDEGGQDDHGQQRARPAAASGTAILLPSRARQAPGHRDPRDEQRPSNATGDEVTDFVAEQPSENVVAEFAVAVAFEDMPGDGDAPPSRGVGVDASPVDLLFTAPSA